MNRESYNAIAAEWDAARSTLSRHETVFLGKLLADMQPPASILDLGCGTGRPIAGHLLAQGFSITGIDQAQALLSLARQRFPEGRWLQADMESFTPDSIHDAAIIWDSLFHISREKHEAILQRIIRCLRPGGRLMLTVGGSEHPAFTDTMFGQTFFYDSLTPEQTIAVLKKMGAVIDHAGFLNPPTTGRDKGRYGILARVRSAAVALAARSTENPATLFPDFLP